MAVTAGRATTGVAQIGGPHDVLTEDDIRAFVHDQLEAAHLDAQRVRARARRHPQLPAAAAGIGHP
jgi:hypothetical protein